MEDEETKKRAWEKVTDKADPLLIHLREAMPPVKPVNDWDHALIDDVEQKGRMYTEVLLMIIYARAAYERSSLGKDPSLRKYCRQIKEILAAHTGGNNAHPLMLSAASENKQAPFYAMLQEMNGQGPENPDSYLAQHVRGVTSETQEGYSCMPTYYNDDRTAEQLRQVTFIRFSSKQWLMVTTLYQVYYRVSQLEALLDSLIDNDVEVNFDDTGETRLQLENMIAKISND